MNRPYLSLVSSIFLLSLTSSLSFGQGLSVSSTTSDYNGHAISCHGQSDGSIDLSVSGGTSPYTLAWSTADGSPSADGAVSEDLSNLSAGNYQVIVNDSLGAADTIQFLLTQPAALSISLFSPQHNGYNIHCSGGAEGQINATVSGGVAPYVYQWSTGDSVPNLGSLLVGSYQLIVIGANGCSDTASITLTEPAELTTSLTSPLTASGLEIPCEGSESGSIDLTVSSGAGSYLYNWSNGGITQDLNSIGAGWYSVQVSDGNGCVKYDSLELREPTPLTYTGSAYEYQPGEFFSCDTCNDGQATTAPTGGTPPYSYLWSNGQTTQTATELAPDVFYSFTITDDAGCTVVDSFSLPANQTPNPLELIGTVSSYAGGYQVSSTGATDGWIDLQVIGGSSPFSYNWSNGATTQDISGLSSGTYTVTVTDDDGEQAERSFTLTAPSNALQVFLSTLHPSCFGQSTGFMEAMVSGGTPPYTYEWSTIDGSAHANGSTLFRIENLEAGSYSVIVRDANNDSVVVADTVVVPDEILTSVTPSVNEQGYHLLCADGSQVVLDLQVSGGLPPYTYLWDNGKFTQDITVEEAGMYMVQVKDDKNCIRYDSLLVTAPEEVQIDADWHTYANGQLFSCDTCNDAQVTIPFTGGVPPYDVVMYSNTDTLYGPTFTGIYADTSYSLHFEDAIGCVLEMTGSEALVIPRGGFTSLQVDAEISNYPGGYNISSAGGNDGWINLDVSGQMSQETVLWSDGSTEKDRSGLSAGYYEVTVSDDAGQSVIKDFTLIEPQNGMSVQLNGQFSSCMGSGNIDAMVMGGTPPYVYHWEGPYGQLSDQWSNITVWDPGTYNVLVTDANNDSANVSIDLFSPAPIMMGVTSPPLYGDANASCTGNDGSMVINLSGGTPPYMITVTELPGHNTTDPAGGGPGMPPPMNHINLSTSDTIVTIDSLAVGSYDVRVSDMGGCGGTYQYIELTSPPALQVSTTPSEYPGGGYFSCDTCTDGTVDAAVLNGVAPYSHAWFELANGDVNFRLEGASIFFNDAKSVMSSEDPNLQPIGTGSQLSNVGPGQWYALMVMDELGCMGTKAFLLEKPKDNANSEHSWKLNGNSGVDANGQQRWLGTNDSTDLVLKSNNLEALKLKADGSAEFSGNVKASGLQVDTASKKLLVYDTEGNLKRGDEFGALYAEELIGPCQRLVGTNYVPSWTSGIEKIFVSCQPIHVGIGTDNPISTLDVRGLTNSHFIRVNSTDDLTATRLVVTGSSQPEYRVVEFRGTNDEDAFSVYNDGKVVVGSDYFNQTNDRASLFLGNGTDHYISAVHGKGISLSTYGVPDAMVIEQSSGKVNIGGRYGGTANGLGDYKLSVNGKVLATEFYVTEEYWNAQPWPDFVFSESYSLKPLDELRQFIEKEKHLPEIPSAKEVEANGIGMAKLDALLLQKIEELTLYMIEVNDKVRLLEEENQNLKKELNKLR